MSGISSVSQSNQPIVLNGSSLQVPQGQGEALNLKNGAVIQGTVVSVNDTPDGKLVNINVSGNEISARLQEGMDLKEGQSLQFAVKGLSSRAVTIMPLFENTAAMQSTIKALTAAGLETTPENVQMVKDMMEAGLPIDKASLQEMSKNLNLFSNSSVSTLVEMKSLNIPINENNINGFESYKNYEHQVVNEMEDIIESLPETYNALISGGEEAKAMNLYGSVLKLFGQENAESNLEQGIGGASQVAGDAAGEAEAESESIQGALDAGKEILDKSGNANKDLTLTLDMEPGALKEDAAINSKTVSNEFIDTLKNLGVSDKNIEKLITSSDSKALLNELAKNYEGADLTNVVENAAWKKLFSSDEYNKIIKDNISEQWLLKPSEVEDKENIQNLYQRLNNQVKHLAETVNNTGVLVTSNISSTAASSPSMSS